MSAKTIQVAISYVDGGYSEQDYDASIVTRLRELQAKGLTGKRLVDRLLTDDWAAPPTIVELKGVAPDGSAVDIRLAYD
ncbi:MAG TPA: hypothetical protein VGM82_18865 [Gemmatimonadaceae bacterium]|jgi:hypothetical protein